MRVPAGPAPPDPDGRHRFGMRPAARPERDAAAAAEGAPSMTFRRLTAASIVAACVGGAGFREQRVHHVEEATPG